MMTAPNLSGARGVVVAAGIQLVIGLIVQRPWWVPDLLLVSLVVIYGTAGRTMDWTPALVGGALAMCLGGRAPLLVGFSYVGAAGLAVLASVRWDVSEREAQAVELALLETGLLALWMLMEHMLTFRTAFWSAGKILLTVACLPWMRRVMRPSHG